jgi:hypothetical protein
VPFPDTRSRSWRHGRDGAKPGRGSAAFVLLDLNAGFLSIGASTTMNIDQQKVNQAIRDCLSCSEEAPDRLAKIEGFLLLLKMSGGWDEVELHYVETRVRKILCAILDDADGDRAGSNLIGEESQRACRLFKLIEP